MKGMIFFILGIIIVFGLFSITQRSTESNQASDVSDRQEIKQQLEEVDVEINMDDLEKVE